MAVEKIGNIGENERHFPVAVSHSDDYQVLTPIRKEPFHSESYSEVFRLTCYSCLQASWLP